MFNFSCIKDLLPTVKQSFTVLCLMAICFLFSMCSSDMEDVMSNTDRNQNINFDSEMIKDLTRPMAIEWDTIVYNGNPLQSTASNQKVLMSNVSSGGYGTGVFICDVTSLYMDINVPNPNEVVYQGVIYNRCGYVGNVSTSSPNRGTVVNPNFTSDGKVQRVLTYCYYIRYTTSGTPINKWVPCAPSEAKIIYKKGF